MAHIYLAHQYNHKNYESIFAEMKKVTSALEKNNNSVYCSLFDDTINKNNLSYKEVCQRREVMQKQQDHLILYIKNKEPNRDMERQVQRAKANNQLITLLTPSHEHISLFEEDAHHIISYNKYSKFSTLYDILEHIPFDDFETVKQPKEVINLQQPNYLQAG